MSSLAALLHDDADTIVVSGSRRTDNGGKAWFNRYALGSRKADRVAVEIASTGRNVYCKHGVHDGTLNEKRRPLCTANHFLASRAFFIDIDVGHGSGYATISEAAAAFKTMHRELRQLGLPKPNLFQNTGAGLQAVWVVQDPLPADEWKRVNRILFLLAGKTGVKLDSNLLSIDRAVRYCGPSFQNVNHGKPRATEVVWFDGTRIPNASFVTILDQHGQLRAVPSNDRAVGRPASFNDRFRIAGQDEFQLDLSLITDQCEVVREAVLTGGENHGYRHWTDLLALAAKNGDEEFGLLFAHEVSKHHPGYDADATEGKFYGYRNSGNKKYVTCARFEENRPDLCSKCSFYKKLNSPAGIQGKLAAVSRAQGETGEPVVLDAVKILEGEYFNSQQGVRRKKRGEEETNPLIWPRVTISNVGLKVLDVDHTAEMLSFDLSSNGGGWARSIEVMAHQMHSHSTASRALSEQQVPLPDRSHKPVQEALVNWLQDLRARNQRTVKYTRLGWTGDKRSFVLGSTVYHADGSHQPIPNADHGLRGFDTKGDFDEYQDTINTVFGNEDRAEAHAFIAASLGSPLLHLVGAAGMALNFHSFRSGHGKTTLSQMAGSLWGTPKDLTFTLDDTENSIMRRISIINNLPALHDEMRIDRASQEKVIRMVFRLNSSKEKSRLHSDSKLQERGDWRTLMLFSTNYTFLDMMTANKHIGGEAAIARTLDFALPPLPLRQHNLVSTVSIEIAKLDYCNGWVGHNWIDFVVQNRDTLVRRIRTVFQHLMKECAVRGGSDTFNRNHCFAGAVMVVAAHAASTNGILPLNAGYVTDAVKRALIDAQLSRNTTYSSSDPLLSIRDFMHEFSNHTITVVKTQGRKGSVDIDERTQFRQPIVVEVNRADKIIYVDAEAAQRWFNEQGYKTREIIDGLERYRVTVPRSMGNGTRLRLAPRMQFAIPMTIGIFANMAQD